MAGGTHSEQNPEQGQPHSASPCLRLGRTIDGGDDVVGGPEDGESTHDNGDRSEGLPSPLLRLQFPPFVARGIVTGLCALVFFRRLGRKKAGLRIWMRAFLRLRDSGSGGAASGWATSASPSPSSSSSPASSSES